MALRHPGAPGRRRLPLLAAGLLLSALQGRSQEPGPAAGEPRAKSPRDVRYVIVHAPGPKWQAGRSAVEQPFVAEHVAHYRTLQAAGKLALGGPFLDERGGGMMIPEAGVPEAELRAFAEADPAVRNGVLEASVRPWLVGMRK